MYLRIYQKSRLSGPSKASYGRISSFIKFPRWCVSTSAYETLPCNTGNSKCDYLGCRSNSNTEAGLQRPAQGLLGEVSAQISPAFRLSDETLKHSFNYSQKKKNPMHYKFLHQDLADPRRILNTIFCQATPYSLCFLEGVGVGSRGLTYAKQCPIAELHSCPACHNSHVSQQGDFMVIKELALGSSRASPARGRPFRGLCLGSSRKLRVPVSPQRGIPGFPFLTSTP